MIFMIKLLAKFTILHVIFMTGSKTFSKIISLLKLKLDFYISDGEYYSIKGTVKEKWKGV